jgi:hypothetical protein
MSCPGCGSNLFGVSSQYIKTNAGDLIATDGANVREKLILSDMRIPYKQILKSRVILKPGQVNYLLNHLGMGDNATFLSMRAMYDPKSKLESDNYVEYSYYDDLSKIYTFGQLLTLTGNSTNRIKQLYLNNPNPTYPVYIDIMVAVIDDSYSFFNDFVNQTATTFTGLEYTDIQSYVIGQSIVVYDKSTPARPLVYFTISDISSMQREGTVITVEDSIKVVLLKFLTENDAAQALSILNYVTENPWVEIAGISPIEDTLDPVMTFYSNVGGISGTGSYISFNGATAGVPYDTSYGYTFSTSISLSTYGSASVISKQSLIDFMISSVVDTRDGTMSVIPSNILIANDSLVQQSQISGTGSYEMTFDFSDIALNYLDGVFINLDITE